MAALRTVITLGAMLRLSATISMWRRGVAAVTRALVGWLWLTLVSRAWLAVWMMGL